MKLLSVFLTGAPMLLATSTAAAKPTRVIVTIENLAPTAGTFQTPFWVGFHEGRFDTYDRNTPASDNPQPGSVAMERLCEDGNNDPIAQDFAALSKGIDATIPGPNGPIAPGEVATLSFVLDAANPDHRFFSYASMILPSNDFCISNANPQAHPVFDAQGKFIAKDFFVAGSEALDAGTEVNDEIPANTAFFGQATPNTGLDQNGVIGTIGPDSPNQTGFMPRGSGGILNDPQFRMGDFRAAGYPFVKISFAAAEAVIENRNFSTKLSGANEVPAVATKAFGFAVTALRKKGTSLQYAAIFRRLRNITMAHLHLGGPGENGPVVASLLPQDLSKLSLRQQRRLRFRISGALRSADLVGPLSGQPLDALVQEIKRGNVYVNVHTKQNPGGELRGQLKD